MNPVLIDRTGLAKVVAKVPKNKLAMLFGISLPTLRRYIGGEDPVSPGIAEKINNEICALLKKRK